MSAKFKNILVCLALGVMLLSCTTEGQKQSLRLYNEALQDFEIGNYNVAKLHLDSIHELYPEDVDLRRKADTLRWRVEIEENKRNVAYYDSVIVLMEPEVEKMRKKFVSTGDSAILGYDVFIHRTQGRSYLPHTNLLAEVRDNGELSLISVFMGSRELNHTSFQVSCEGVFKQSEEIPLSSAANNRFDDLGIRWEYVTYRPQSQNGTAEFVAEYADKKIMVTLNSAKSVYKFYLDKRDKNAIKESVEFATLLKGLRKMQTDRRIAADNILWIENKLMTSKTNQ